jgi:glycerophosphoryl diester phosphodiesterase
MDAAILFPFLDAPCPLAFAHRGGGEEGEENTLEAFEHAAALGYRYIETDVQVSRDGVPIVFHDDSLERMTGVAERVDALAFSDLARLQTLRGARIARLDEALASFPDMRFNVEPKADRAVEPLAEAIRRAGALDRVCVGCFDDGRTERLRHLLGPSLCWSPGRRGVARFWAAAHGLPVRPPAPPCLQVPPRAWGVSLVSRRLLAYARARRVQIHVWTIDNEQEMENLLDRGVDGIMTGRPSLLRRLLERRRQWHARPTTRGA